MAKVSNRQVYVPKTLLSLSDYFIITDSEGSKRTKTTEFRNLLTAINTANGVSVLNYTFSQVQNEDINFETPGYFFSSSNETNPALITKLFFNKLNIQGIDCTSLFEFIVSNDAFGLRVTNSQDPNNIIIFKPTDITVNEAYLEIDAEDYQGMFNGGLVDESVYSFEFVFLSSGNQSAENVSYSNGPFNTVAEALDSLLYIAPDITNFSVSPNIVEIGTTVSELTFSWNLNKIFTSLSINNGIGSVTPSLLTLDVEDLTLTSNTIFTITGGDGMNNDSASASLNFRSKRWWGTSPLSTLTGTDILNLQNSELATGRQQTRTINGGGNYIWFAFPTSFGLPSFVVNGLPNTAFTLQTVSHTNESGNTQNYYVIRTDTIQNGTLTIQVI